MVYKNSRWSKVGVGLISYLLVLSSCFSGPSEEEKAKAEQQIEAAHKAKDYQRLMTLADQLEAKGALSPAKAYYWRGYVSDRTNRRRMAEFYYNTALKAPGHEDLDIYAKTASHLANLMAIRGDFENGLRLATPVVQALEEQHCDTTSDYVNLLIYIGCCQAGLGTSGEATADGFDKAYEKHLDNVKKNRSDEAYKNAIAGLINMAYSCNHTGNYREALKWNGRISEILSEYEQRPGVSQDYVDKQQARYNLYQAQALEGEGKTEEAAKAFDAFLTTEYAKTPEGRIMANDYLFAAKRWAEAADNYQSLSALLGDGKDSYSLDNIQSMVLKKYQANLLAGRRDSAVAISMQLCDSLAGAFNRAKEIDAAEQAVIVGKVEEIGDRQVAAERRSQLQRIGMIGLLFFIIVGYGLYRRYNHQQLKKAHEELQEDLGTIETEASERSRTETEHSLADAIRQRISHAPLPQRKDMALYVSQTPGTMPGGSFYDARLSDDDTLLFCIGSAEAQGISAATAAAMAWAQFRTAAALGQAPEQIVNALSEAIADGQNIPVRLFVGRLDLATGLLRYCNAGNNTPLITDKEISLLPTADTVPAGSQPGTVYTAQEATVAPGKLLFVYTNGVAAATAADGKPLGDSRLRGMALQAEKLDAKPQAFYDNILKAISDYTAGTPQADDLTLMVIARK